MGAQGFQKIAVELRDAAATAKRIMKGNKNSHDKSGSTGANRAKAGCDDGRIKAWLGGC
jgi:hypothetical protein